MDSPSLYRLTNAMYVRGEDGEGVSAYGLERVAWPILYYRWHSGVAGLVIGAGGASSSFVNGKVWPVQGGIGSLKDGIGTLVVCVAMVHDTFPEGWWNNWLVVKQDVRAHD